MRVLFSIIGWMVKLTLGVMFASSSEMASSSGFMLLAFGLINAIGLHVLLTFALPKEVPVVPPKPVFIGLAVAALLAIGVATANAQPVNGCQQCIDNGNNYWYCLIIYGYYCL